MGFCEKHDSYNPLGDCSLCWKEEQVAKANQHNRYKRALELAAAWFKMHMPDYEDYDVYVEIKGALDYDGTEVF